MDSLDVATLVDTDASSSHRTIASSIASHTPTLAPYTLPATPGSPPFVLPSIHSWPPFFTQQLRNPTVVATQTQLWTRLLLSFARHRRIFVLRLQDAEQRTGTDWADVLYNPRIKRGLKRRHLEDLMRTMVANGDAAYEPEKQTSAVLLYWRRPEQWAETIHEWVTNTGQLNTILTFYELIEPEVPSPLSGLPLALLTRAIAVLRKSGRAQMIDAADGGGVRFFAR